MTIERIERINNTQQLEANFKLYLDGFSDNVKDIIAKFNLSNQVSHMAAKDVLLDVLEKFTAPAILSVSRYQ